MRARRCQLRVGHMSVESWATPALTQQEPNIPKRAPEAPTLECGCGCECTACVLSARTPEALGDRACPRELHASSHTRGARCSSHARTHAPDLPRQEDGRHRRAKHARGQVYRHDAQAAVVGLQALHLLRAIRLTIGAGISTM
eukprot:COSAG01_NODE_8647_length_2709_cov_1.247893_3_plen_143_part_00